MKDEYCTTCGKKKNENDIFCSSCGKKLNDIKSDNNKISQQKKSKVDNLIDYITTGTVKTNDGKLKCLNCGGNNIDVQFITVQKRRGLIAISLILISAIIFLFILPLISIIIILIPLLIGPKIKNKKKYICRNCGYTW